MNLQKLFQVKVGLNASEKKILENLDANTEPLRIWKDKVAQVFPATAQQRKAKIQELAVAFANQPSPETFEALKGASVLGQNPETTWQDQALIFAEIDQRIAEIMLPQAEVIRAVIRRSAETIEKQLNELMSREKRESDEVGIPWQASGVVMALQAKVLSLRNRTARENLGYWRDELADLI